MDLFIEGILLQASLILVLGSQNIFILECGLKQRRPLHVAFVSAVCDTLLILVGVLGAASVLLKFPLLKLLIGGLGVVFLIAYAFVKLSEVFLPSDLSSSTQQVSSAKNLTLLTLSFSLLNPHVYLDIFILIGSYSAKFSQVSDRLMFGAGAALFSSLWFFALALLASHFKTFLSSSKSMRVVALLSSSVLLWISWRLAGDVYRWYLELKI